MIKVAMQFSSKTAYSNKLMIDPTTIDTIIKNYPNFVVTFPIESENKKIIEKLISQKSEKNMDIVIDKFLGDVKKWYENEFGIKNGINPMTLKRLHRWKGMRHLHKVFPFVSIDVFLEMKNLKKYPIPDSIVKHLFESKYLVPPNEIRRLRKEFLNWIKSDEVWSILKKYYAEIKNMKKDELSFKRAVKIIMNIKSEWLMAKEYGDYRVMSEPTVSKYLKENKIKSISLNYFSLQFGLRIPPQELKDKEFLEIFKYPHVLKKYRDLDEKIYDVNGSGSLKWQKNEIILRENEVKEFKKKYKIVTNGLDSLIGLDLALDKLLNLWEERFSRETAKNIFLNNIDDSMLVRDGGINLDPSQFELETRGGGVEFSLPSAQMPCGEDESDLSCHRLDWEGIRNGDGSFTGFTPVIFQIQSVPSVQFFLGEADEGAPALRQKQAPFDLSSVL